MNINEPFDTLTEIEKGRIVDFSKLLLGVQSKVSRPKVASSDVCNSLGRGIIDKLEIFLSEPVHPNWIRERCLSEGFHCKEEYKKDKKLYLCVKMGSQSIDCLLGHPDNEKVRKVIINPSKEKFYFQSENNLLMLFGPKVLDSKVYRIDFTVDIYKKYEEIIKGLEVKYKRANVEFMGGSVRTGLLVGTGKDKALIYNKGKKEKTNKPCGRIERQISSSKLIKEKIGVNTLGDLRYKLSEILEFDPLSIVTLNHLEFVEPIAPTIEQLNKFNELKALIKHEGYFLARKKLNNNRNFLRDYGSFFVMTPYKEQPSDIFNRSIINIFKETVQ